MRCPDLLKSSMKNSLCDLRVTKITAFLFVKDKRKHEQVFNLSFPYDQPVDCHLEKMDFKIPLTQSVVANKNVLITNPFIFPLLNSLAVNKNFVRASLKNTFSWSFRVTEEVWIL